MAATKHRLTSAETARAIYIDLEGKAPSRKTREKYPPTLCGWIEEDRYSFVVFDERFAEAAQAKGGLFVPMEVFMGELIARATREKRRIVHWTSKEADECTDLGFPLGSLGYDLRPLVKRRHPAAFSEYRAARKALNAGPPTSHRKKLTKKAYGLCVACAEEEGLVVPSTYGWGKVGRWIRGCEAQSDRPYSDWSSGQKGKWTKLLSHNQLDCRAMVILSEALFC